MFLEISRAQRINNTETCYVLDNIAGGLHMHSTGTNLVPRIFFNHSRIVQGGQSKKIDSV